MGARAPFGWTVVKNGIGEPGRPHCPFKVYKRDCPATAEHFAADLAPFTHTSRRAARAAGKVGNYAYRSLVEIVVA